MTYPVRNPSLRFFDIHDHHPFLETECRVLRLPSPSAIIAKRVSQRKQLGTPTSLWAQGREGSRAAPVIDVGEQGKGGVPATFWCSKFCKRTSLEWNQLPWWLTKWLPRMQMECLRQMHTEGRERVLLSHDFPSWFQRLSLQVSFEIGLRSINVTYLGSIAQCFYWLWSLRARWLGS